MCVALATVVWKAVDPDWVRDWRIFLTRIGEPIVDLGFIQRIVQSEYFGRGEEDAQDRFEHQTRRTVDSLIAWIHDSVSLFKINTSSVPQKLESGQIGDILLAEEFSGISHSEIGGIVFPNELEFGLNYIRMWTGKAAEEYTPFDERPTTLQGLCGFCWETAFSSMMYGVYSQQVWTKNRFKLHSQIRKEIRSIFPSESPMKAIGDIPLPRVIDSARGEKEWDSNDPNSKKLPMLIRILVHFAQDAIRHGEWTSQVVLHTERLGLTTFRWTFENRKSDRDRKRQLLQPILDRDPETTVDTYLNCLSPETPEHQRHRTKNKGHHLLESYFRAIDKNCRVPLFLQVILDIISFKWNSIWRFDDNSIANR